MSIPALEVRGLRKVFYRRRQPLTAVDNISFSIAPGSVVGLLGANGAGKTTTIKCILGLIEPTEGHVAIAGVDARRRYRKALRGVAAVLEGNRNIYWRLTVRENLFFFANLQGLSNAAVAGYVDELIQRFHLQEQTHVEARQLSLGMKQKLAVACSLVRKASLLILDEPTLGLDVETSHQVRHVLRELAAAEGRTIVLSSHDMGVVQEACERVIIVNAGRVVADDRVENLLELFRARAYRFRLGGTLTAEQRADLQQAFELVEITETDLETSVRVQLLNGDDVYTLIDILAQTKVPIEGIDRQDPNLEEIFLHIVRGEGSHAHLQPA